MPTTLRHVVVRLTAAAPEARRSSNANLSAVGGRVAPIPERRPAPSMRTTACAVEQFGGRDGVVHGAPSSRDVCADMIVRTRPTSEIRRAGPPLTGNPN